jgi:cytochrome c
MKCISKIVPPLLLIILINSAVKGQQKKKPVAKQNVAADIETGKLLVTKSDCMTCHRNDFKLVGPAYKDVAIKYATTPNAITYLSGKIIKGGGGVWGEVPMAAHPTITPQDAKKIATYILTIK